MEETYISPSGDSYTISIDDFGERISVTHLNESIGGISLRSIEGEFDQPDIYHITHLELDKCKGQGIGRRCLQFHKEIFCAPITAGASDGRQSDDGSHLTGDGPCFIQKMKSEGLVDSSESN